MKSLFFLPAFLTFVSLLLIGCGEKTVPATRAATETEAVSTHIVSEKAPLKTTTDPFSPRNPLENLAVVVSTPEPPPAPVVEPPATPIVKSTSDPFPKSPASEAAPAPVVEPPTAPAVEIASDPFPKLPSPEPVPTTPSDEAGNKEEEEEKVVKAENPAETVTKSPESPDVPVDMNASSAAGSEEAPAEEPTESEAEKPVLKTAEHTTVSFVEPSGNAPVVPPTEKSAEKEKSPEKSEEKPAAPPVAELPVKLALKEAPPEKPAYDPIAVNGEIFVDWPKPKLLLVFTGFMNGYVEPCGCAGIEQMKGGLSRRHTFFKELKEKRGWPVLAIDGGNLNKGFGRQEELKYNFVIDESLRLMNYRAAGIGNRELLFSTEDLILYVVDVPGSPKRYTSANVAVLAFDPTCTTPYRVLEENGVKVAVTSVLGPSARKEINNEDIVHEDAVRKLKEVLPKIIEENCDRKVLIVNGTAEETNRILKAVTGQFDFVVVSDTPAEPPLKPNWIENSMLIEVGEKGKFAVGIGLYDDPDTPIRYQRIPLDSRFENSKDVLALMRLYQDQLKETGLKGLGIKPIPERRAAAGGNYAGSKSCADCHEPSYGVWRKSRHAAAWRSLAETSNPPRTHDPECIACHVVGWSPTEFLPYENGFLGEKETPHLMDVGCESCHGPGENHNKAEAGNDEELKAALRKAMRLPLENNAAKKLCIECHDGDNSPHFDFDTYWPKVVHSESEE